MHYSQTDNAHETRNAMIFYFLISLDFQLSVDFVMSDCTPKLIADELKFFLLYMLLCFYSRFMPIFCLHTMY